MSRRIITLLAGRSLASALASLMQAALFLILAAQSGPESFGLFVSAYVLTMFISVALGFGFSPYSLRSGEDGLSKPDARSVMRIRFTTASFAAVVVIISYGLVLSDWTMLLTFAALLGLNEATGELRQSVLSGRRLHLKSALLMVLQRAIPLLGLLLGGLSSEELALLGSCIGAVGSILLTSSFMIGSTTGRQAFPILFRDSRQFWWASCAGTLSQIDQFLVAAIQPISTAGLYSVGARMATPVSIMVSAVNNVFVPELTRLGRAAQAQLFRKMKRISWLLAGSVALVSPALAYGLVWLLGPEYDGAQLFIIAFFTAMAISAMSQVLVSWYYAFGKAKAVARAIFSGTTAGIVFLIALSLLPTTPWLLTLVPLSTQIVIYILLARSLPHTEQ